MIDFQNGALFKLKRDEAQKVGENVKALLLENERILSCYSAIRDYIVFTNKRIICCNVQGITGKKRDYTSLPYSKISAFSVETSGVLDLDSELEIHLGGVGKVKFEFSGSTDIIEISKYIASFALN